MKLTRKERVLEYLRARPDQWVPGLELMNQYVGGLRAGARIYELREEGYAIERRSSKTSAVDEYRLVTNPRPVLPGGLVQLTLDDFENKETT